MANEIPGIEQWVENRIKTDPILLTLGIVDGNPVASRVYDTHAPASAIFPYIVITSTVPRDTRGVGTTRIMVDILYSIKVVASVSAYTSISAIANRIDALFHGFNGESGAVAGSPLASVRESALTFNQVEDGREYRHLGGIFRIYTQAA